MNDQIFIEPSSLDSEIAKFKSSLGKVEAIKYDVTSSEIILESITKYLECLEQMTNAVSKFNEISELDITNLEFIKSEWLKLDDSIANKTLIEGIMGK